jgi:LmbE family N-acetylglucosaminyl deacetylase
VTILDRPSTATGRPEPSGPAHWHTIRTQATRWRPPDRPTTVVVPHPDDEALLFGGLIEALCRQGTPVDVVAVTDGEAAYDDVDERRLAARRRREQQASLDVLGLAPAHIRRLGLPDGDVAAHVGELAAAIVECGNRVIVAPWRYDHHCDHEACGRAAHRAASALGGEVFGGMFWAWHHTPVDALGRNQLVALDLGDVAWSRRRRALEQHRSQLERADATPVLTDQLLEPVGWRREYYVVEKTVGAQEPGTGTARAPRWDA